MSLPIYQRVAVTDSGDVIPGAEYTVINENTGVAAPIYSDRTGATLLTAPYFADSVGTIQFFIAQGTTFRVAASGGVGTYTDRYIYAAHPQSSPTDTTAGSLMAVGAFGLGGDVDLRNTIYSTGTPDGLIGKGYAIGLGSGSALGVVVTGVGTLEVAGVYSGTGVHSGFTRRFTAQGRTFVQSGLSGAAWGDWHEIITADAAGNVGIGNSDPAVPLDVRKAAGGNFIANFQNTTAATPYGVSIKDAVGGASGYPLFQVTNSAGSVAHLKVMSGTGDVIVGSGVVFGDAGGTGTGSSNTLDEYERGTFVPDSPHVTLTSPSGSYLRVGDVVHVSMVFNLPSSTSGTGVNISGLPFAPWNNNSNRGGLSIAYISGSADSNITALLSVSGNVINFFISSTAQTYGSFSDRIIYLGGTYIAA